MHHRLLETGEIPGEGSLQLYLVLPFSPMHPLLWREPYAQSQKSVAILPPLQQTAIPDQKSIYRQRTTLLESRESRECQYLLKGISFPASTKSKDKGKLLVDLQSFWDIFMPLLKQVQRPFKNGRGLYKHNEQMVTEPTLEIKYLYHLEKIISDKIQDMNWQ